MYKVILKQSKGRGYYYNYITDHGIEGTIQCDDLPAYQDIIKARSCYLEDGLWVFDQEKYAEMKEINATTANNEELSEAVFEIASTLDELITTVSTLAENIDIVSVLEQLTQRIADMKGGK